MDDIDVGYKKKWERQSHRYHPLVKRHFSKDQIRELVAKEIQKEKDKKRLGKKKVKGWDRKHIDVFNSYRGNIRCCQKCGGSEGGLNVHHIDKNHNNNDPLNLIKLCYVCHCEAHKGDNVYNLMIKRLKFILDIQ